MNHRGIISLGVEASWVKLTLKRVGSKNHSPAVQRPMAVNHESRWELSF